MPYTSREVYEFISRQTNDPIVERKTCAVSGQPFAIYQSDLDFYAKISSAFAGQRFQIPTPTLCPEERQRRRLLFRNERKLYKRKCDATGETIISIYSPDKPYKVYKQDFWWSDKWDPMEYGRDFDFSKNFLDNFSKLFSIFPRLGVQLINCENCDYSNIATSAKNCYLSSVNSRSEDVHYSSWVVHSQNTIDSYKCGYVNNCYNCINCNDCSFLKRCLYCSNSNHCYSSTNLEGCAYCINCNDLINKEYYINNQFVGKENFNNYLKQSGYTNSFNYSFINKSTHNRGSEASIGDGLIDCSQCILSYDILYGERCKYYADAGGSQKDCVDNSYGGNAELCFENISCMGYGHMFSTFPRYGSHIIYSDNCHHSSYLFGCIGLRNKSYCIFNKQYTKEEYETTVAKIISHMQSTGERGEFFHPSLSPFGYNETVANEYFPVSRTGALAKGYTWHDHNYDPMIPEGANVIDWKTTIDDPTQDEHILKAIFVCESSGRPYRIIKQELEFYHKHNLPLPRKHPDIRHEERMKLRPGRTLYLRNCDKTGEEMLSVYPPDYPGKVYSEKAYQEEVFG